MRKKVLVLTSYYLPCIKGGGPTQSIKNLSDNLSNEYDFFVLTSDRDLGDIQAFRDVETEKWIQLEAAKVYYTDSRKLTFRKLLEIINSIDFDVVYLNSFFSYKFSISLVFLRKLGLINKLIVIAPRGEFSKGALSLKSDKKKMYINVAKLLRLYKDLTWHATSEAEKKDIKAIFGGEVNIKVAKNLTANYRNLKYDKDIDKIKGALKITFISRIHPMKNLMKAIDILGKVHGEVIFDIYGPIEDEEYWCECEQAIEGLPQNVKVTYKGIINHDEIMSMFKAHHVFLFPTLGENFGHVISEALIGGCPVIISDQTPWRGLKETRVGWDIALSDEIGFVEAVQYLINIDRDEYNNLSRNAFEYGKMVSNKQEDIRMMYELFK